MTAVAILIPGIMGSELSYNGDIIWPGPVRELLFSYGKFEELKSPDLVATAVVRKVGFSVLYESLIEDLELCAFRQTANPPTLYTLPYDWRKDNRLAAAKLADLLNAIAETHEDPEVTLVAHSMGGLVARYYLESNTFNEQKGFASIRALITLGTPHRGSPEALTGALGQEKALWLNKEQARELINDYRYPSTYQLLPPEGDALVWNRDPKARYKTYNIYDKTIAAHLGLNVDNLKVAQEFHSKLDYTRRPKEVRYFTFVGTRQTMMTHLFWRSGDPTVEKSETEDAGDGTVPLWSAGHTGIQGQVVGGVHATIYRNGELRRTLGILLGSDVLRGAGEEEMTRVEVAVRERVCEADQILHIALTFPSTTKRLDGELRLEKSTPDMAVLKPTAVYKIQYTGLSAEKLNVTVSAPTNPGMYRVAFYDSTSGKHPSGSDELFVQSTVRQ